MQTNLEKILNGMKELGSLRAKLGLTTNEPRFCGCELDNPGRSAWLKEDEDVEWKQEDTPARSFAGAAAGAERGGSGDLIAITDS